MNEIVTTHLIVAGLLLAVSMIMKIWPPKKINYLYGYRTPRSMKSQRNWDIANNYGSNLIMWAGITNVLVHLLSYALVGGDTSLIIPMAYFLSFLAVAIVLIEIRLKRLGD